MKLSSRSDPELIQSIIICRKLSFKMKSLDSKQKRKKLILLEKNYRNYDARRGIFQYANIIYSST